MDIESLRHRSWCLCRQLDTIVGTKEEVALRRFRDTMRYYVKDVNISYKQLYSGSRGEGFDLKSSDIDLMYIDRNSIVLECIQEVDDDSKTVLLMNKEECNPGFVMLGLINETNNTKIEKSIKPYNGHRMVSSSSYRQKHKSDGYVTVEHGPCITHHYNHDIDTAYCFQCDKWPTEANEFISRQRLHEWPPKSLLTKIIQRGCHLVPTGEKDHKLSELQWRLSFSEAEKDLVFSFNHTQFLVYGLMKLVLKQFNQVQSVENILCSYFIKTLLFYAIESTPKSFWRDDLLIPCFWFCLNKLFEWVEKGNCPNYFVRENNMFRGKVVGENQQKLRSFLDKCRRLGWTCIYLCKDLQPLLNCVLHESTNSTVQIQNKNNRESVLDIIVFRALHYVYQLDTHNMHRSLARSLPLFVCARTQQEEDISKMILYTVVRNFGVTNACTNVTSGKNEGSRKNKDKYRDLSHNWALLSSAAFHNYSGGLTLATFYYITGQYKKAEQLCNLVFSKWKPYVLYDSKEEVKNKDKYEQFVCGHGVNVSAKANLAYAFDIIIQKEANHFYPTELIHDMTVAPLDVLIPPLPYTVFLLFLCHHKLGNIDKSINALHDLKMLINDEQQGCRNHHIVLNLLAICLEKLGDIFGAEEACKQSLKLKPQKNGATAILEALKLKYS